MAAGRMNSTNIGLADKTGWLLSKATPPFLYIGNRPDIFLAQRVKLFDSTRHHFNPLIGITPERALDIADILYAADPGGENTLTVRNGKQALAEMLVTTTRFDKLTGDAKDPAQAEALRMIRSLLFFPTLKDILCTGRQFDFSGSVVARIDPAVLGRKQSLLLTLLLIGQHQGQIILDDGGRYLRPLHMSLIDQDRLTVGIRYLAELPKDLQDAVLTINDKHLERLLPDDAERLIGFTDTPSGNPKNLM